MCSLLESRRLCIYQQQSALACVRGLELGLVVEFEFGFVAASPEIFGHEQWLALGSD